MQVIGVGAAVLGDMSSRPYWGLYELDFVFCTIIVSCGLAPAPMWPAVYMLVCQSHLHIAWLATSNTTALLLGELAVTTSWMHV